MTGEERVDAIIANALMTSNVSDLNLNSNFIITMPDGTRGIDGSSLENYIQNCIYKITQEICTEDLANTTIDHFEKDTIRLIKQNTNFLNRNKYTNLFEEVFTQVFTHELRTEVNSFLLRQIDRENRGSYTVDFIMFMDRAIKKQLSFLCRLRLLQQEMKQ
ncbi:MAG: hypothetical protein Q9M91_03375 [Candidatus Dojkabacteria bacterium]|nr:hypothetical protein [Candidatus Dojkabacteria bacterium]MDQ7020864.1 hypothetical protein [Candidatus Dojkabacteria bacterium]